MGISLPEYSAPEWEPVAAVLAAQALTVLAAQALTVMAAQALTVMAVTREVSGVLVSAAPAVAAALCWSWPAPVQPRLTWRGVVAEPDSVTVELGKTVGAAYHSSSR